MAYGLSANWLVRYQGGYSFERSFSLTHRGAHRVRQPMRLLGSGHRGAARTAIPGSSSIVVYRVVGLGRGKAASRGSGLAQFSFLDDI